MEYTLGDDFLETVSYMDVTGAVRMIEFHVRLPSGASNAPIVVWSHGGSDGVGSARRVGEDWAAVFVRAGYASVNIAHRGRTVDGDVALCDALGLRDCGVTCSTDADCQSSSPDGSCQGAVPSAGTPGRCYYFLPLSWDRPNDFDAVMDWLDAETEAGGRLEGAVDMSRLVYGGHSAGAGSAVMTAGGSRTFGDGVERLLYDDRPIAYLLTSPQGPGEDGFTEESLSGTACLEDPSRQCLTRPMLYLSGVGDDTGNVIAETRRGAFDFVRPGEKYLLWVVEEAARHATFDMDPENCVSYSMDEGLDPSRCDTYGLWLRSASLAFLDAYVRDLPEARAFLDDAMPHLAGAGAEWAVR